MIANYISNLFSDLWLYLMLFGVGAAIGIGAWVIGRFTGLLGAAAFGAVAILAAYTAHDAGRSDADKVRQLQAQIAMQQKQIAAAQASKDALDQALSEREDTIAHNEAVMSDLTAKIDALGDRPDCKLPGDILDDLRNLR